MIEAELGTTLTGLWLTAVSALGIFVAVVVFTRIGGLRSFSKMSSFDFAVTVAIGSLIATVAVSGSSLANGAAALGTLYLIQFAVAAMRRRRRLSRLVDNEPLLLMAGRTFLDDNLRKAHVTEDDIRAKLREANVFDYATLRCVVLETTGDISVIHGEGDLDAEIFQDVIDADRLA